MPDCCSLNTTEWDRAQSDWLTGVVTANVVLAPQDVKISFDGEEWIAAEWTGSAGTSRGWQAYVTPADIPPGQTYEVTVHITDTSGPQPVEAFIPAGTITFT